MTQTSITFDYSFKNVSKLCYHDQTISSPPCYAWNIPWKIVIKIQKNVKNNIEVPSFGFFLECCTQKMHCNLDSWSFNVVADLRVKSYSDNDAFSKQIIHRFHKNDNKCGSFDFISWDELMNPTNFYCMNDTIILKATISTIDIDLPGIIFS